MSQSNQSENLSPFEARLAELAPRAAQVGRDELLFEAGRRSAERTQRRVTHRLCAVCAVLACMVGGQWVWLADRAGHSETSVIADRLPSTEVPVNAPAANKSATDTHVPLPTAPLADESTLAATTAAQPDQKPSLWAQLFPLPTTDRAAPVVAQELSVGSSVQGTLAQAYLPPKPGRMRSQGQLPLLLMRQTWSQE